MKSKIIRDRAQLIVATRDLLYADALLMEDLGNSECDYCSGGDGDVSDGHDLECPFATAFEVILQERAQGDESILDETRVIRDALVMLVAADYHLMGTFTPCFYCKSESSHESTCELGQAIDTLENIPRP